MLQRVRMQTASSLLLKQYARIMHIMSSHIRLEFEIKARRGRINRYLYRDGRERYCSLNYV